MDVTVNDSINFQPVQAGDVIIYLDEPASAAGITFNETNGRVYVEPGTEPGNYNLIYSICDAINPDNCDQAMVLITVTDECDLFIPNGFSPNSDNINDHFIFPDLTSNSYGTFFSRKFNCIRK